MLKEVIKVSFQQLHHQKRKLSFWEEAEAKKLGDIGVVKA